MNILMIDDEKEISDILAYYLKNEQYTVWTAKNTCEGRRIIEKYPIDLLLLDVMLPDTDGFSFLQEIRYTYQFPVIMVTAKIEDIDKINGLTLGADDYITKPFNPLEVVARVKSQLRRATMYEDQKTVKKSYIDVDSLHIDLNAKKVSMMERDISLTPIEYGILLYLVQNKGKAITSEEIFEQVWGERFLERNNTVMTHIARLREKLGEDARKPKVIKTVWGVGYIVE